MFSLEKFYKIISVNLFQPINVNYLCFDKFGSINIADLKYHKSVGQTKLTDQSDAVSSVLFYDQEPLYLAEVSKIWRWTSDNIFLSQALYLYQSGTMKYFEAYFKLLANSEISEEKNILLDFDGEHKDWYYFFHGFAALDWFGDLKYYPPVRNYSRVFISFNNLYLKKRSYRLNLVARLLEKSLDQSGYISLPPQNLKENVKKELFSKDCLLSVESKKIVYNNLYTKTPKLIIDTEDHNGELSANGNLDTLTQALFHVVTETVYYDKKLHLTEKIFKPIASRRPFLLVAAPGNLAYLKSYGFKTFDRWIDESYDLEPNHDKRISLIVQEIERLCQMPKAELDRIYQEMWAVLDYNFEWFYNGFKHLIVNELVDNFHKCLLQHNAGLPSNSEFRIDYSKLDFADIKQRLAQ